MEILKEKHMKLLSRKRVSLLIDTTNSTPKRTDLIKDIAKKFNVKPELVVIKHIYPQFGRQKVKIIAHLYEDEKKMKKFEHENLLKKHKSSQSAKSAPEAKAAPQQEEETENKE